MTSQRDLAVQFVRRGLDATLRDRAISDEAAVVLVATISRAPHLEHAFACGWDAERRLLTSARWIATGSPDEVRFLASDIPAGEVMLHNHPQPFDLTPSLTDLETGAGLRAHGIGSAIASNDLSQFVVLHPPVFPRREATVRTWRIGPLAVSYLTQTQRSA